MIACEAGKLRLFDSDLPGGAGHHRCGGLAILSVIECDQEGPRFDDRMASKSHIGNNRGLRKML
jgi:hypothetical protein